MPNVIVNTSPLQYLFQVGLLDLLPSLYGNVIIPQAVLDEADHGRRQGVALPAVSALSWVRVVTVGHPVVLPMATRLGAGEYEVLLLAKEMPDSLIVLDDSRARHCATQLGIRVTGTLGILLKAKQRNTIAAVTPVLDTLNDLGFRLSAKTRALTIRLAGEHE